MPKGYDRNAASRPGDNAATAMKSVVVDCSTYDWEGDRPLIAPSPNGHLRNARARFHPPPQLGSRRRKRGTYAGLIEKIPYLQELGITAVELLPVFQYDAQDAPKGLRTTGATVRSPSLHPTAATVRGRIRWARSMNFVTWSRRCTGRHRGHPGRRLQPHRRRRRERTDPLLRGLENSAYYILEDGDARYANYSGTGNTLNANHVHRPAYDPRQPALLGAGDARGRLPFRPGLHPLAR